MNSIEIRRKLDDEYSRLRESNILERDRRIEELGKKDEKIPDIIHSGAAMLSEGVRTILRAPERTAGLAQQIKAAAAQNEKELHRRVAALGYPENYLDPIYTCPVCKDRGYVGDALREMCSCYKQKLIKLKFEYSGNAAEQTFENFDLNIFPDTAENGGKSQRQLAAKAKRDCEEFADSYPVTDDLGLLFIGSAGLGKTYLVNCIANRLIGRGFSPVTVSAYKLYELMHDARFGDSDKQEDFDQLINCDMLLIDDLGAEPQVKNITIEDFFMLINERFTNGRHTIISTNLSSQDLINKYGDRTFSRLIEALKIVKFAGKDLRIRKAFSQNE